VSLLTHTFAPRKGRLRDRTVTVHAIPILAIPGPIAEKREWSLDKANKYAGDAGATVHASQEGGEVVCSLSLTGPGIKPGELERIFEKFYRGGRADGRKAATGLGLSISRRLVEAMGGTIVATPIAPRPAA
jgi:K+-sensing histidine kinase KdpD